MPTDRPNPDKLLKALKSHEGGNLQIYFGYAAGVGKTYAMLSGARELKRQGIDVVVGYLEAHGRRETEALLEGLEVVPSKIVEVGGSKFRELDLDLILERRPTVVLVDEMAHTNATTSRHTKRWEDIQELLEAGIDVHTTLNVQHLESLNDIVAQITGVRVHETIPDAAFDRADEVTLVDITADELLKRFKSGKVYREGQAERAMGNYFKKTNLVALREIALRRTADRVHADVNRARLTANIRTVVPTHERLACLITPWDASALRATARLATQLQCPWLALDIESAARIAQFGAAQRDYEHCIELAGDLGGRLLRRRGIFRFLEVLQALREENITKLVLTRPRSYELPRWVENLIFHFVGIDIVWVNPIARRSVPEEKTPEARDEKAQLRAYLETTAMVGGAFVIAALMGAMHAPEANLTLVYLLAVIAAAVLHGEAASAYAALLTAVILSLGLSNFEFRLSWSNTQYLFNFGVSLLIGLLASQMTSRLKNQAEIARKEQELTEALYNFTTMLASSVGLHQIVATAQTHLQKILEREVVVLLPDANGDYRPLLQTEHTFEDDRSGWAIADWVAEHEQPAGRTTRTLPNARALYLPLMAAEGVVGVLAIGVKTQDTSRERQRFERFSHPLATKIESAQIAEKAEKLYWQAERERLRGDLFSSISQALKEPLASLAQKTAQICLVSQNGNALEAIRDESVRLQHIVDNFTQLTRFETGDLPLHAQRIDLSEFVKKELAQPPLQAQRISFQVDTRPLWVEIDPLLFSQVLSNILENALAYSTGKIYISTRANGSFAELLVEDEGEGIPEEQLERIFEKYYRLSARNRGAGLGLTVCRAIVEAHHGKLWAENRHEGGLRLLVQLLRSE